jgi:uncharacterized protein YndB with AHSA1/START domain
METMENTKITVEAFVNAPVDKAWECFNDPKHIVKWNHASEDWHSPRAENDLRKDGRFNYRMEARDGSMGFDFTGTYIKVEPHHAVEYTMDDNRKVQVTFQHSDGGTKVVETFEAEQTNSIEMQREGWQSILNNFKKYVEGPARFSRMHIEILIDAAAEKVYRTMLEPSTYNEWTSAFNPSSRYEGSWEKGSTIRFIGEDQEGNKGGMISRIRENIPNKFVSIEHLGIFQGDKDITSGPEVEKWAGGLENYTFEERKGNTLVLIDVDVTPEFEAFFGDTWPKALNRLKELCETM